VLVNQPVIPKHSLSFNRELAKSASFCCGMEQPKNSFELDGKSKETVENVLLDWEAPKAQGLYDPQNEHEACGVGFIVAIDGKRNHKVSDAH